MDARLVPIWRGKCLVEGRPARALTPRLEEAPELIAAAAEVVFLGLDGEVPVLMVHLPPTESPPSVARGVFLSLLTVAAQLPPEHMSLLAYAKGMAHWHHSHRFDPATGLPTRDEDAGFARVSADGSRHFPRTDPAAMVLVVDGPRCLLAHGVNSPPGMYSALAGFLEPGESLEDCAARETFEEVGVEVDGLVYFGSQAWPFPRSLMVAFTARARTTELRLDETEILRAKWLTREEVLHPSGFFIPPPFSLAHHLIMGWARAD